MDNVVQGKVVDRRTGQGLEDLLVVVYDVDEVKRGPGPDMGVEGPIISDDDQTEPQPVDRSTPYPPNFTLGMALAPDARTWIDYPGDRLGSVLTQSEGKFSLSYKDDLFRLGEDKERRPELVLMVMGPDHSKGVSVLSRLLHYSYVPRNNAGRIESYIIHVDLNGDARVDDDANRIGELIGRLRSPDYQTKKKIRRKLQRDIPRHLLARDLVRSPYFVPPSADRREENLAIGSAIVAGVERIVAGPAATPVVYLTEEHLGGMGIASGVPFEYDACEVLRRKGLGTDLVRIRRLVQQLTPDSDELDAAEDGSDTGGESGSDTVIVEDTDAAQSFIAGRVLGQVASLPRIKRGRSRGIIDDLATIKERINALEMSSGPANVTAFRDFHSLQIAFKNVWSAALDKELTDDVEALYNEINALHEAHGDVFPDPSAIADLSEFEDYIASINADLMTEESRVDAIPTNVASAFGSALSITQWNELTKAGRDRLSRGVNGIDAQDFLTRSEKRWQYDELLQDVMNNPSYKTAIGRLQRLVLDIDSRRRRPYSFKYYKEYSVNYGILLRYRQEWRPKNYQVGRLVATLPLAPGESRELKISHKVKLSRAEKEVRKSLIEKSYESSSTVRSELDVLAKLSSDTNFRMSAQGSFTLGIGSIESSSEFSHNQKAESQRQHKQISEATRKASEKVRQEREIQVDSASESEAASESTQKIHNPNNEVTVTYLMYELERRYHVSQSLNRVTPVIMVALDMPSPHDITEGWILEYAWILRRVLLDDMFEQSITWLEKGRQSESVELAILRANYERDNSALKTVEQNLDLVLQDRRLVRNEIIGLQERKDRFDAGDEGTAGDIKDFFLSGGWSLFGGGGPDEGELMQAGIEAAKSRLGYVDEAAEELSGQQRAAQRAARESGRLYAEGLKSQAQKDTLIRQFQMHLRQNIFHYMHAIWETRHPDDLFFTLVEQYVVHLSGSSARCRLVPTGTAEPIVPGLAREGTRYEIECAPPSIPDLSDPDALDRLKVPLGSIAHVDQLLGFKGNYAIFPLKDCTPITDYMAGEFVDDYLGVRDPVSDLGISTEELVEYAREAIQAGSLSAAEESALRELVTQVLQSPTYNVDDIILPTGQIYMEALKGEQALLEDFKLAHRGMDVLKVQEEVRSARLENLRKAGRMTQSEPDYSDPDIDKHIVLDRDSSVLVDDD